MQLLTAGGTQSVSGRSFGVQLLAAIAGAKATGTIAWYEQTDDGKSGDYLGAPLAECSVSGNDFSGESVLDAENGEWVGGGQFSGGSTSTVPATLKFMGTISPATFGATLEDEHGTVIFSYAPAPFTSGTVTSVGTP